MELTGAVDNIGYGTGLLGATSATNGITIDPDFLTTSTERAYRLSVYKTSPGGSLTRLKDTAMDEYYT